MLLVKVRATNSPAGGTDAPAISDLELHMQLVEKEQIPSLLVNDPPGAVLEVPVAADRVSRGFLSGRTVDYQDGPEGGFLVAPQSGTDESPRPDHHGTEPEISTRVRREIRERVNPLVDSHGGAVTLVNVSDAGIARIEMRGGCQGCTSARATLEGVVERILLKAVPELRGVRDVTDHDAGVNPWYAAAGCSSPETPAPDRDRS